MKLTKHKLGELVEVSRGASLSGQFYAEEGELIRLTLGNFNMNGGGFKENTSKTDLYFTGTVRDEFILNKGDIITPLTEQSVGLLGTTARIPESGKYIQSQDVALVRCKEGLLDPNFCYYLISSSIVRQQLSAAAQQTKIRHTSPDKIKDCTVWVPCLEDQKSIGRILTDIDEKIIVNRRINDNLEAMSKQLYDYWFVQFDFPNEEGKPYKSSGGAMVYNEKMKREIPQGWHCYELNKWLEIKSGFAFKSETYISKGKFKVVTIKNVQDHHLDTSSCDYVYEIPQGMKEWCSLSVNDRLISLTGNCGRLCIVTETDLLLNQRVGLLACNDEYIDYAYLLLSSEEYQTLSNNLAKGAAQANLSPVDLCKNIAVLPKLDVLEKFNRQIKPIVASYIQNEIQIAELTKQRDELLLLLMNGQATVNSD
ncbi:restriction endonuclease subunit S [Leyella stercorea]|uniref:restriction endonuclease subunit S n=2 Tax=Leyella stercorea TaxID=363265 RepID=UPI003AF6218D